MSDKLLTSDIEDVDFVNIEGESEDITDMQNDIDGQINRLFEEFGGDTNDVEFKVHVKRAIPGKGEMEICFQCTASELPITDRIIKEYGHGTYEIWIYKNGKRFRKRVLNIAKPLGKITQPINPQNSTDISALLTAVAESNRQNMEQMQAVLSSQSRPQQSLDIIGLLGAAVPLIGVIKELIPKPPPPQNELGTFMKAAEFVRDLNGSGDNETNFFDMAKTLMPSIIDMSTKIAEAPKQEHTAMPTKPVEVNPQLDMLKKQIGMLVVMANAGKDPTLYADLILDQMPIEQIQAFITRPDAIEFLTSLHPGVGQHREWFIKLQNEVTLGLTGDVNVADTANIDCQGAPHNNAVSKPETRDP